MFPGPADCNRHAPDKRAANHPAGGLPEEAQHVALLPVLLAVKPEQLQLSPVVKQLQVWVPDPTDKAVLHSLQALYTSLVRGKPQLVAVVKPRLDEAAQ